VLSQNQMDKQPMMLQLAARDAIHKYDLDITELPESLRYWCSTKL